MPSPYQLEFRHNLMRLLHLLCLLILTAGHSLWAAENELKFGIVGSDSAAALRSIWTPFLEDMSKETGLQVTPFFATDYTGVIEAMRFEKVQIAWYGNKSAIEAVDRANGEVFCQFIGPGGTQGYYSYIITHRDSAIKTLDDMFAKGKELSFGMGDPQSTSGTLVPGYYVFALRKVDPKSVFRVTRSSNHGSNILAILNRQLDVATNNSEELEKFAERDPVASKAIRILWTSPLIPRDPLVWRKDLSAEAKAKIRTFVLAYGRDEREKAILLKIQGIVGFKPSTDRQLFPIRQLELFKERSKVMADEQMEADERARRLQTLDNKLKALEVPGN